MFTWLRNLFHIQAPVPEAQTNLCKLEWVNEHYKTTIVGCLKCGRTAARAAPPCPHLEPRRPPVPERRMAYESYRRPVERRASLRVVQSEPPASATLADDAFSAVAASQFMTALNQDSNPAPAKFESGGGGDFGGAGASGTWESPEPSAPSPAPPPYDPPPAPPPYDPPPAPSPSYDSSYDSSSSSSSDSSSSSSSDSSSSSSSSD